MLARRQRSITSAAFERRFNGPLSAPPARQYSGSQQPSPRPVVRSRTRGGLCSSLRHSMHFRTFHNADPPRLAALWQSCEPDSGLCQPMTALLMEDVVFSKPYFDHDGLIVAQDNGQIVGFVHAGFGLGDDRSKLDHRHGVVSMLMVHPSYRQQQVATELLALAEQYLIGHGAQTIQAGEWGQQSPFYLGLYGPSACPGLLKSAGAAVDFFQSQGYRPQFETRVLGLQLAGFRPPIDRKLLQVRRSVEVHHTYDPVPSDWWEACRLGVLERVLFELAPRSGNGVQCQALVWYHEPTYREVSGGTVGLHCVTTSADVRKRGFATFLLSEAFKHLSGSGFEQVTAVCQADNALGMGLLSKLGFVEIDQGLVLCKQVG